MGNNLTNKTINNRLDKVQDFVIKLIDTSKKTVNCELNDILQSNEDYTWECQEKCVSFFVRLNFHTFA